MLSFRAMYAKHVTPILNVSDLPATFAWFEKWGWKKCRDWGTPPVFGSVGSGECEIFLCRDAQGSRGKGASIDPTPQITAIRAYLTRQFMVSPFTRA